jgi:hypothetical protein
VKISNKTSKIIVGSSLKLPRPLLGRPTLAVPVLSPLTRATLALLAGRSMRFWEEEVLTWLSSPTEMWANVVMTSATEENWEKYLGFE